MVNRREPKILDCTIRDGGHLNGWNFSDEFVAQAYAQAAKSGADYFETGYRYKNIDPNWGKWARCDELSAAIPGCKLTVMAHALKSDPADFPAVESASFAVRQRDAQTSFAVRVAARADVLPEALEFCENLDKKGYEVFLNLTEVLRHDLNFLNKWRRKDIPICLADSLGQMSPEDVERVARELCGFEKLCFHGHGARALENTLRAVELGFYCVDGAAAAGADNPDITELYRRLR